MLPPTLNSLKSTLNTIQCWEITVVLWCQFPIIVSTVTGGGLDKGEEDDTHCHIALSLPTITLFPSGAKDAPPRSISLLTSSPSPTDKTCVFSNVRASTRCTFSFCSVNIKRSHGSFENFTNRAAPYGDPTLVVSSVLSLPEEVEGVAVLAKRRSQTDIMPSCEATANMEDVQLKEVENDQSSEAVKVAWWWNAPDEEMSNRKISVESPTQTMDVLSGETEQWFIATGSLIVPSLLHLSIFQILTE